MAAKLQCEICGGKLVGKPGGIFECESCGVGYSIEWARAKIREIDGAAKNEAAFGARGGIWAEGAANKDSLLKRARISLDDMDWDKTNELCERVLNIDPECAEAYLLLSLADAKLPGLERVTRTDLRFMERRSSWKNAKRFGDEEMNRQLDQTAEKAEERWRAAEKRAQELSSVKGMLHHLGDAILALDTAGKAHVYAENPEHWACAIENWPPLCQLETDSSKAVGVCLDGTVLFASKNNSEKWDTAEWSKVRRVAWKDGVLVGLKGDGTLCSAIEKGKGNDSYKLSASGWDDVEKIAVMSAYNTFSLNSTYYVLGLTANGTIKSTDPSKESTYFPSDEKRKVPFCEEGWEAVALGKDESTYSPGTYRVGLDGNVWEQISPYGGNLYYAAVPVPTDAKVIAVLGNDWNRSVARIACLTEDGRVMIRKPAENEYRDLGWRLFDSLASLEQERAEAAERQAKEQEAAEAELRAAAKEEEEAERKAAEEKAAALAEDERRTKIAAADKEKDDLQAELGRLKGLFSGKRRKEIQARLAELEAERKKLE
ncbi:MAG: hypothetical protein ACSW8E_00550 [Clostridia bacterium]